MSDFTSARTVTARKRHTCDECCRAICPTDAYVRIAGVWEGEFYSGVLCARCNRLHGKAWKRYGRAMCDGPAIGGLLEWIKEARGW